MVTGENCLRDWKPRETLAYRASVANVPLAQEIKDNQDPTILERTLARLTYEDIDKAENLRLNFGGVSELGRTLSRLEPVPIRNYLFRYYNECQALYEQACTAIMHDIRNGQFPCSLLPSQFTPPVSSVSPSLELKTGSPQVPTASGEDISSDISDNNESMGPNGEIGRNEQEIAAKISLERRMEFSDVISTEGDIDPSQRFEVEQQSYCFHDERLSSLSDLSEQETTTVDNSYENLPSVILPMLSRERSRTITITGSDLQSSPADCIAVPAPFSMKAIRKFQNS
jgi:hypothetical protein